MDSKRDTKKTIRSTTCWQYPQKANRPFLQIDISNPEKPKIVGTIKNVYAREMVVRGGYAYIADPDLGLVIFDVSDPASPVLLLILESIRMAESAG